MVINHSSDARYLYRGVSHAHAERCGGRLLPKELGAIFEYGFKWGEVTWGGADWGTTDRNAVVRHQLRQEGFPTSGISTTPSLERAAFYATAGGRYEKGLTYEIDRELLLAHGVREYVVVEYVPIPSVPEDAEVILVAHDKGPLPEGIVVRVFDHSAV